MLNFIFSLLVGMVPEVLYFTLFIVFTKGLKEKRIRLFLLIALSYILCIMIIRYELLFYIIFIFVIYFILKLLYKENTQIIDVFIIMYASFYLTIVSYLIFFAKDIYSYILMYILNRILLFSIFVFHKYFNKLYEKYKRYWNRNDNIKRPIKSITLRNISIIVINCIIFIMNIICLYMINLVLKWGVIYGLAI